MERKYLKQVRPVRFQEIAETPQIVPDEDWNLDNRQSNAARAADLLRYNPEVLEQFPAAQLVRLAGTVGGQYGLISTRDRLLEYYVQYDTDP